MNEIPIKDLQRVVIQKWQGGVLSGWIDIVRAAFPEAEVINYYGSTTGRINGVLYEFFEKRMYNEAPYILRSYNQQSNR